MKKIVSIGFLLININLSAQHKINPTDQFAIEGKVVKPVNFLLKDLDAFAPRLMDSFIIYNHLLEPKTTIKGLKGVLLKDLINKAGIDITSPKLLSEIYFVCIASDNRKVVFSWDEIYNSGIGDQVLIVTACNNKTGDQMPDRITLLSAADRATGRRYVKGLQKIVVEQVK